MFDRRRLLRHLLAAAFMLACVVGSRHAFRAGMSRLMAETTPRLSVNTEGADALGVAGRAVELNASDPEAHDALAVALARRGEFDAAERALERAATLRPRYFRQWQRLGRARTLTGYREGALAAYAEAVRLAPFYAEPRWQLGNELLRGGRTAEAFAELRRAAESRPALAAYTAELAWRAYDGEARAVAGAVAPHTAQGRVALARFFARRGRESEALEQYRAGGAEAAEGERRSLVSDLIAAGKYRAAREVWAGDAAASSGADAPGIGDGGFESQSSLAGAGFEWQFARDQPAVRFSLDSAAPRDGARSLLVTFGGDPDPSARLVTKLFTVEPGARYRLVFAARSEELVSAGLPVVALLDPADARVLAQAEPVPVKTDGWREYQIEFTTPADGALLIVRRSGCAVRTCPIFGRLWLDAFTLQKL
ncbi:MAG TPA: hypothetical protein VF240_17025 [Pyrinomonadaceae bacterium]